MKVFCDFHHGALARSMWYLFADRLGHDFYFPTIQCAVQTGAGPVGTWGCPGDDAWPKVGFPDGVSPKRCEYEEFRDGQWDIMLLTRRESEEVFKAHGHPRPGITYIGVSGNEGTRYNRKFVHHLIATDLASFHMAYPGTKKIHTLQELGRRFDTGFHPITEEYLHTVRTYMCNLSGFGINIAPRHFPGGSPGVNVYQMWQEMAAALPDYTFMPHGHGNEKLGGTSEMDMNLPQFYYNSALSWHFKTYEGYGHSLLQSLPSGRPVIVPERFYDDRTAGRFLIEGETAFHCDYSSASMIEVVKRVTVNLETANHYAKACYDAYKRLFDWQAEAERVRQWLAETV